MPPPIKKVVPSKRFRPPERNRILLDGTLDPIQSLAISVSESGRNAEPLAWRMTAREAVRERIPCNNPDCFDGGFSLGDLLRELVKSGQNDYVGTCFCTGQEGDPEMPGPRASCATRYAVEITLRRP
jgi:hypothetical protein